MYRVMFIEMIVAMLTGGAIFALGFFLGARERMPIGDWVKKPIVNSVSEKKSDKDKPKTSVWTQDEGERARLEAAKELHEENKLPHPVERK